MTRPQDPDDHPAHRHDGPVLGETAEPTEAADDEGTGVAGPSWPPEGSEPDAR